ncbi:predicted protein [Histoplasma capsulatum var. duboisii H88]|uniref:Predicted protein n=1 Tax=Ajellomyces capsulatus (strain H88) TaxID=544711 RepID=F0UT99_AJEC8|nr:predicted protein [Histoplasma capsulatum var. duboisii H88]
MKDIGILVFAARVCDLAPKQAARFRCDFRGGMTLGHSLQADQTFQAGVFGLLARNKIRMGELNVYQTGQNCRTRWFLDMFSGSSDKTIRVSFEIKSQRDMEWKPSEF